MTPTEKILELFDEKFINLMTIVIPVQPRGEEDGLSHKLVERTGEVKAFLTSKIAQALAEEREREVEEARQTLKKEDSDIVEKVIASLPLTDNKKDNE